MDPKGNYWGLYILGMWIFSFLGHLNLDDFGLLDLFSAELQVP